MADSSFFRSQSLLLAACLALLSLPSLAEKPEWVEGGKSGKPGKQQKHDRDDRRESDRSGGREVTSPAVRQSGGNVSVNIQIGGYFRDSQRVVVRDYYEPRMKAGKCPPGLKKKGNGCQPPGQAKGWSRGEPLPTAVVYYPVPAAVQVRLGVPPEGHKFVRVASDILLIAIGTSLVVDAIEDLGRL
jgi:Ni/Co efflux regulator RcnB